MKNAKAIVPKINIQDAVKQRNTMGNPLDFDVDWAVDNLLHNNDAWKSFVSF